MFEFDEFHLNDKNNVSTAVLQLLPSAIFEGENKMNSLHCTPRFVQSRPEGESSWNSTGVTAKLFCLFLHLLFNHLLLALHLAFFLAVQQETFPPTKSPPNIGEVGCTPPSSTNLHYVLPLLQGKVKNGRYPFYLRNCKITWGNLRRELWSRYLHNRRARTW